jgi:hypothetical protein
MTEELMKFLSENPAVQNGEITFTTTDVLPRPVTYKMERRKSHQYTHTRVTGEGAAEWRSHILELRNFLDALVVLGYLNREGKVNHFLYRLQTGAYAFLKERLQVQPS